VELVGRYSKHSLRRPSRDSSDLAGTSTSPQRAGNRPLWPLLPHRTAARSPLATTRLRIGRSAGTVVENRDVTSSVVYGQTDDFALPGPGLMQIARLLANELGQSFGVVDSGQINEAGQPVSAYWFGGAKNPVLV
jgi:hypothetical protein